MTTTAPDETRLKELRQAHEAKVALVQEGARKAIKIEGENVEISPADYKTLQDATEEIKQIKNAIEIELLGGDVARLIKAAETPDEGSSAEAYFAQMQAKSLRWGDQSPKTVGQQFMESDLVKSFIKSGKATMDEKWELEAKDMASMGTWGQKDVYTGSLADAVNPLGFGSVQFDPAVPRAQRQNRVRSLFPVATTSANLIDFFRVLGWAENLGVGNAAPVPERSGSAFGLKPQSNLTFEAAQAPVRTIAHWEAAHRNVLQDEPQLRATIDNELLYGLALVEDDEILNGDGTGEHLLGIQNTPGIQVFTAANNEIKSDSLRRAQTLSMIANYPSTGFVLHPNDWEDIELQKGTGDGQYMLFTNIAVGLAAQVWRSPVVETPAQTEGQFLSGAFGFGAQLYDRMLASIRISENHEDFFVRNAIVILAEERLALAVKRPEAFVLGTFDT